MYLLFENLHFQFLLFICSPNESSAFSPPHVVITFLKKFHLAPNVIPHSMENTIPVNSANLFLSNQCMLCALYVFVWRNSLEEYHKYISYFLSHPRQ